MFDICGICCGFLVMPFWTFFLATLLGKSLIKVHLQVIFFLNVFGVEFFHVLLFEEMLNESEYKDVKYVRELIHGLKVAGPVAPSNVWATEPDPAKRIPKHGLEFVLGRAWEYKAKTELMNVNEYSAQVYKDLLTNNTRRIPGQENTCTGDPAGTQTGTDDRRILEQGNTCTRESGQYQTRH